MAIRLESTRTTLPLKNLEAKTAQCDTSSPARCYAAFLALTKPEQARLNLLARTFLYRTNLRQAGWEPNDLIQEAKLRALRGSRYWPPEVHFVAYMAMTMKSIVWDMAQHLKKEEEAARRCLVPECDIATPEAWAEAQESIVKFQAAVAQTPLEERLLTMLVEGYSCKDLADIVGLTPIEAATALRRLKRRATAHSEGVPT